MFTTTWGPSLIGRTEWALPYDLWGTLIATTRLAHGNIGGLYAPPTGLISLPGAAVILLPCAALISALGLSLAIPGPHNLHPAVWLVAGPYQIALVLRHRCSPPTRWPSGSACARWKRGPARRRRARASCGRSRARWGHPEDAVAVGLLLYAVLAQSNGPDRGGRAGWPGRPSASSRSCCSPCRCMLALLPWRRMVPFLVRGALPSAVLLAATAIANWHDTYQSVTSQPNSPVINHPTVVDLARPADGQPQRRGRAVPAGHDRARLPVRAGRPAPLAVPGQRGRRSTAAGDAPACRGTACRTTAAGEAADPAPGSGNVPPWTAALLADVLWWVAFTLALRSFFEPVMVSYYPWPPMAVALIPAATLAGRACWPRACWRAALPAAAQGPSHAVLDLVGADRRRPHRAARPRLAGVRPP